MERHFLDPVSVEYVVKRDNMLKAWKQVRANKGAASIDGISIEEFPVYACENWKNFLFCRNNCFINSALLILPDGLHLNP